MLEWDSNAGLNPTVVSLFDILLFNITVPKPSQKKTFMSKAESLQNTRTRTYMCMYSFPGGASGEPTCQCRRCKRCGFDPWVGKSPWRRKMAPHSTALAWIPHSTALAWRILWTEEPVGLQSMGSQKVRLKQLSTHAHAHTIHFAVQ